MTRYSCTWADEEHDIQEIGFNLPDAAFALDLPEDQRAAYRSLDNEDDLVIGDAHFVRCHAPLRLEGVAEPWGLGLWVKISASNYAEFVRLQPGEHPPYQGAVANQDWFGLPILGAPVEILFYEPRDGYTRRPVVRFAQTHPLAVLQASHVPQRFWREYLSRARHQREREPKGQPFEASLERHGWLIHEPEDAGLVPATFERGPRIGDTVKAVFGILASDHEGEPTLINAGWWVVLDDVDRPDLWSGTLANDTRVPATVQLGSRIWLRPGQIIEHAPEGS